MQMSALRTATIAAAITVISTWAASPAHAEAVPGYSSYHVERQFPNASPSAENCIYESYGAVINGCPQPVSLAFDLPANSGGHDVKVQDYWNGWPGDGSFTCEVYAYDGTGAHLVNWASGTFNYPGTELSLNVNDNNNNSIQLICWGVPPGAGIANINWG